MRDDNQRFDELKPAPSRAWPDYGLARQVTPSRKGVFTEEGKMTDTLWAEWAAARGWLAAEITAKLGEISDRARSENAQGNKAYAVLVGLNAVDAIQRAKAFKS